MSSTDHRTDDAVLDPARLEALGGIDLRNEELRSALDQLASAASEELGLPIALVSMVLHRAQYMAGASGLGGWILMANGTPVEWSFCQHVVGGADPLVVGDARHHDLLYDSPLVVDDGVVAYAGVPITDDDGNVLGSMCVADAQPHAFSASDVDILRRYAKSAWQTMSRYRR